MDTIWVYVCVSYAGQWIWNELWCSFGMGRTEIFWGGKESIKAGYWLAWELKIYKNLFKKVQRSQTH